MRKTIKLDDIIKANPLLDGYFECDNIRQEIRLTKKAIDSPMSTILLWELFKTTVMYLFPEANLRWMRLIDENGTLEV